MHVLLAAIRDDSYNVVLLIHIVAFLVAFAPAVINPFLEAYFRKNGGEPVIRTWAGFTHPYTQRTAMGGLVVLLVTGVLMILMSDDVIEFSDTWISLAFVVWFAITGVVSGMIGRGERQVAEGNAAAIDLVKKGGTVGTILLAVMLYLMVFKPGSPL